MKNILVPLEDHSGVPSVLRTADLVAATFGGRVEVVPLGPDFEALIAAHFAVPMSITNEKAQHELQDQLRGLYDDFMRDRRIEGGAADRFVWNGDDLLTDIKVAALGRVFDVTVIGRPGADPANPRQATLEAVLFESGRPILVAPPKPPESLGGVVAIAWNASTETARTVAFGMPFLKRAKEIVVISVTSAMSPGPGPDVLVRALERHGLRVSLDVVDETSLPAGRAILNRARAAGADLLLKGGYTQSRLRQMVFGGATSLILAEAELPVLMAH
ncbi:MAG: universal stress protein [Telmatospirillum sp.]|nr:universal stress protein [Telmatospirillum sp.]